jgi:hypothetical protein
VKLPKLSKKLVAIGAATGLAMGAAGIAAAYFTSSGSGTGSATVAAKATWTVGTAAASTVGPGSSAGISDTVLNASKNQNLKADTVVVTITSASAGCNVATFTLVNSGSWVLSNATATATLSPGVVIDAGDYLVAGANSTTTGNALSGLSIAMATNGTQNTCASGSVSLSVSVS